MLLRGRTTHGCDPPDPFVDSSHDLLDIGIRLEGDLYLVDPPLRSQDQLERPHIHHGDLAGKRIRQAPLRQEAFQDQVVFSVRSASSK